MSLMSADMPCILASEVWWSRSKRGSVVAERILDSRSRQWSQSLLGTFRFSIFLVEPRFNSRISPSHKFIQGECGSIWFLWHPASRSLRENSPRFCYLDPSMIISGGIPSCLNRQLREMGRQFSLSWVWYGTQVCAGVCNILWLVPYHTNDKEKWRPLFHWPYV